MGFIISNIASIFLIVAVGFGANKAGVLPMSANKYLSSLLLKVTCPCIIITSMDTNQLSDDTLLMTVQALICSCLWFYLSAALGYFLGKKVLKAGPDEPGTYALAFGSANNGFIGFPITLALFGSGILYMMVIHNIAIQVFFLYSLGPMIINIDSEGGSINIKGVLAAAKNPNTIAAVIGFILLFTGADLPAPVFECFEMIGSATTPLSMLIVGMQLGECEFSSILKNKNLFIMCLVKMVAVPALTFLALHWLPVAPEVKVCVVFAASFPAAVAVVPLVSEENKDSLLAAEIVTLTTIISMVMVPVAASILISVYGISA